MDDHARRYSSKSPQAIEVVPDAFLYLKTPLLGLDSELVVLKLLNWKINRLSLYVFGTSWARREITVSWHTNRTASRNSPRLI